MVNKEAMRLALEALEIVNIHFTQNRHVNEAITALREALAEPQEKYQYGTPLLDAMMGKANEALDKKAENARELGLDYEPVWGGGPTNKDYEDAMRQRRLHQLTSPPAQRTWVGLSDLNIDELENNYMKSAQTAHEFLRAIEAKLKEKNGL